MIIIRRAASRKLAQWLIPLGLLLSPFAGAINNNVETTLGGLERQRAYASNRFHDRSAINYTAEYRYMPKWNPFLKIPLVNTLHIPW